MNVARVNSKKYFYDTVKGVLPDKCLLQNPKLVDIIVDTLAYSIPTPKSSLDTPEKLEDYYDTQSEILIEKKYGLNYTYQSLQKDAYQEIINLVKNKVILTSMELKMVKFLESEVINIGVPHLVKDYEGNPRCILPSLFPEEEGDLYTSPIRSLTYFRQTTLKGVKNSACYNCGKVLIRNGEIKTHPYFCTKRENQNCFFERKRMEKRENFEWKMINRRCPHCNKELTLSVDKSKNHYHLHEFFCSEKGYNAHRKRLQRKVN
jgi:endogenous inhibitor of DNA gyrase (YacG/DUF329 family)